MTVTNISGGAGGRVPVLRVPLQTLTLPLLGGDGGGGVVPLAGFQRLTNKYGTQMHCEMMSMGRIWDHAKGCP